MRPFAAFATGACLLIATASVAVGSIAEAPLPSGILGAGCSVRGGTATFDPPLGEQPAAGTVRITGVATCYGVGVECEFAPACAALPLACPAEAPCGGPAIACDPAAACIGWGQTFRVSDALPYRGTCLHAIIGTGHPDQLPFGSSGPGHLLLGRVLLGIAVTPHVDADTPGAAYSQAEGLLEPDGLCPVTAAKVVYLNYFANHA